MTTKFLENMRELRKNPETSRAGLKWDEGEDDKMIAKLKDGLILDDIAKELNRTPGSIKTRIIMNAIKKIDEDGDDPKTIASEYKITLTEIKEFREKKIQRDEKTITFNNNTNNNNNGYIKNVSNPTLKDVYNLMRDISSQINDIKNTRRNY